MLNEYSPEMLFTLCVLAVWRLTHLLVAEDGPWDIVVKLRAKLGNSAAGQIMDCFYCASIWIALPFAVLISRSILSTLIFWLALSGGASLIEQLTHKEKKP